MKQKNISLKPLVNIFDIQSQIDWGKLFSNKNPLEVEIGFGMGEMLLRLAMEFPDRNFIGLEQNWERIYKTLKKINTIFIKSELNNYSENIRILKVDARVAFQKIFKEKSLNKIYCLFPCPWPKKGHVKHRLFSKNFLCLLNNRLKTKGQINIVTDYYPYFEWILDQAINTGFEIKTENIKPKYDTKFERKWINEGQEKFFEINMFKKKHIKVNKKEESRLKSYRLNNFSPEKFKFNKIISDNIAIVYKDMIFDDKKQKGMIHVIVSESELTQHFWASISKGKHYWTLCKADGQQFFPTPGINKALEVVYESAKNSVSKG